MSTASVSVPITVDEFLARPQREDGLYEELIEGEVYLSPNVKVGHNRLVRRIERSLLPVEQHGYEVFGEVACRLSNWSLPNTDVAVIRRDRWEKVGDDEFLIGAPDLAVEVASPGNRQLRRKALAYLEHGAEQVWIIYPKTHRVLVLTPEGDDNQAREGEFIEFHGVTIAVSDLFTHG